MNLRYTFSNLSQATNVDWYLNQRNYLVENLCSKLFYDTSCQNIHQDIARDGYFLGSTESDCFRRIEERVCACYKPQLKDEDFEDQEEKDRANLIKAISPLKEIFANIENTLENLGIKFDVFTKEGTFYTNGAIDNVLKILKEKNLSYEKDGAVWFKTSSLNKEEDKVLVKSSGEPTYRLPDIAYHADKVDRGFDLIVDIFGADHIDTYPDVILGLKCLDKKTEHIKVVIHQFVTIKKGGEIVKMSTRKANFITLDELKDELSSDIIRYFFIMRGANSHLDFDLDLAKDESEKNPVYYLQYANARISNLLKRYDKEISSGSKIDYSLLKEKDEIALVKLLSEFPIKMEDVLHSLEPRKIATYLEEVAAAYHKFYGNHKVINPQNTDLSSARKKLSEATKIILTNGLSILGISAPERM